MLTRRPNVFIAGRTGCGKTTLARKLAAAHGMTVVSASEWFRENFDGSGISDKQAFTDAITAFSREVLARNPDHNVQYLRRKYPLDRGGFVIEGVRNPRDVQHLFDPRYDLMVAIYYPRGAVAQTPFEADGIRLIDEIARYYVDTTQLAPERHLRYTIASVDGPARSCSSDHDPGPVVEGTVLAWNMDHVAADVIYAQCLRQPAAHALDQASGHVHCEITPFAAQVEDLFLFNMDPEHAGRWSNCTVFAVSSYEGHEPTFQVLIEGGSMFSYIPARALRHDVGSPTGSQALDAPELVYHNCHSTPITVTTYATLRELPVRAFFKASGVWMGASYWGSIDWYEGNDLLHILLLNNGQVALLPSHKVLFGADGTANLPPYKKLRATFQVP